MHTFVKKITALFFSLTTLPSCTKDEFGISSRVNDSYHIKNGDYLIPVLVRGNTASKKILLYIQGGPGYSSLDFAEIDYPGWKNSLEKEYAVAYYDQRGTGNKQGNFTQGDTVLTTWVGDLHSVAAFLKKAYDAEIIMLGHSFGGDLMYRYMIAKGNAGIPQKYISTNSPVTTDSEADTLRWQFRRQFMVNTANLEISRGKKKERWKEVLHWLSVTPKIQKVPGTDPYQLMKQWNRYVEELINVNYPERTVGMKDYAKIAFSSPYNPLQYLNTKYTDEVVTRILKEEENDVLMEKLPLINNQDLLIMTGRYDDICPPEELCYIFKKIASPKKRIKIIDNAGHAPFTDNSVVFFNEIKKFVE